MTLGQNIQNARRAQGLSQEALAEKIGVSRQALGKWEKDTALPGLDNLLALKKQAAEYGLDIYRRWRRSWAPAWTRCWAHRLKARLPPL